LNVNSPSIIRRLFTVSVPLLLFLGIVMLFGISLGSTEGGLKAVLKYLLGSKEPDAILDTIVWKIRFPRVLLATLVGATLSLGGLVFQALLRNPLAEPYILGISGGSAIGAIIGILMGFSRFPGVSTTAFVGLQGKRF